MAEPFDTPLAFGLIGAPLEEDLSAQLHNAHFRHCGLHALSIPFSFPPAMLPHLVMTMRLIDVAGFTVTAPYAMTLLPHLDRLDRPARRIGGVNTVVLRKGSAIGYQTDGTGFLAACEHRFGCHPRHLHVAMIGSGGAAHAIADAVAREGAAALTILHRSDRHARSLQGRLQQHSPRVRIDTRPWTATALRSVLKTADLTIQTTSAPQTGTGALRWPPTGATRGLVIDLRYGRGRNLFLEGAYRVGCRVDDGLEMLVQQVAASFRLWTRQPADLGYLRRMARRWMR